MNNLKYLILVFSAFAFLSSCVHENSGIVIIENETLSVKINPLGAELHNIYGKKNATEYLWQGDSAIWASRSPVMFPIVVRIRDDHYTHKGKTYEMPKVGLARTYNFKYIPSSEPATALFEMISDDTTLPFYPFLFRFEVIYHLANNRIIVQYKVENKDKDTLYFATGGHPGFNCPLTKDHQRTDYQLSFSDTLSFNRYRVADGLVQEINIPFLKGDQTLALDDPRIPANGTGLLMPQIPSHEIGLGLKGNAPFVSVMLGNFPNVNIWANPNNPFVCIEPLVGYHDYADSPAELKKKPHFIALPPFEIRTYRFEIIIH